MLFLKNFLFNRKTRGNYLLPRGIHAALPFSLILMFKRSIEAGWCSEYTFSPHGESGKETRKPEVLGCGALLRLGIEAAAPPRGISPWGRLAAHCHCDVVFQGLSALLSPPSLAHTHNSTETWRLCGYLSRAYILSRFWRPEERWCCKRPWEVWEAVSHSSQLSSETLLAVWVHVLQCQWEVGIL